ncbi:MAG: DUF2905 domain-containing protein [Fidelibacterota bacterium]
MIGKLFLVLSIVFFLLWIATTFGSHVPVLGKLGHLPGDIHIHRDNVSIHIPIASSLVISGILTLLLRFFTRI